MWSNSNFHVLLARIQNGTPTLEDSLVFSCKLNHTLIYNSAVMVIGIYLKVLKKCPHKNLHMVAYNSLIHSYQNLEAITMSFNVQWINKYDALRKMGFYSVLLRNELSNCEKTWSNLNAYYSVEEAKLKRLYTI